MKKTSPIFLTLSLLSAALIMALGVWWLYLLSQFGKILQNSGQLEQGQNLAKMVKWEGSTFLAVLFLLMGALIFLYFKDQRKSKSLSAFYAGMTHELKTPLASIRLQAEVLNDLKEATTEQREEITKRLIQSSNKLETQMDKILQLSRIEGGGNLNLSSINLVDFIHSSWKRWAPELELTIQPKKEKEPLIIKADELALDLVLRNLFENTLTHTAQKSAEIKIASIGPQLSLTYSDKGSFQGDPKKLGNLFYKFNSPKGSGIGLYLIKKLTQKMNGHFLIQYSPLSFQIQLSKPYERENTEGVKHDQGIENA